MRTLRAATVLVLIAGAMWCSAAASYANKCPVVADYGELESGCQNDGAETSAYIAEHSDHTFVIHPACELGGAALCSVSATCSIDRDVRLLFNVYEDGSTEPLPWQACLTEDESRRLGGLTPGFVEHAFKRLSWPASQLVVQPPKGKTLVNFATNFYTTNTTPTTQTVTLLGQQVTVEVTPTQYTWHFGAGETDLTTTDPGAAYPDLRVTHRYLHVGTDRPSVDTTYSGRYRVDNGSWQTIPDTLTVPGQSVDLQVLSATPHLVGY